MKFKYLIEIHKDESKIEPSLCAYFNLCCGVNKHRIRDELLKLKELGIKPYSLLIHGFKKPNENVFKKIVLNREV